MRLQIDAAGIKQNAFADEGDVRRARLVAFRSVRQMRNAGVAIRVGSGHRQEGIGAHPPQGRLVEPLESQLVVPRQLRNRVVIPARIEYVRWQGGQPAHEVGSAGRGDGIRNVNFRRAHQKKRSIPASSSELGPKGRHLKRARESGGQQRIQIPACGQSPERRPMPSGRRFGVACGRFLKHASGERQPLESAGLRPYISENGKCLPAIGEDRGTYGACARLLTCAR